MTPFIDCYMWEVKRYPFFFYEDKISNHPLTRIYNYNSLTPIKFPLNYNDIHVPETSITNLKDAYRGTTVENFIRQNLQQIAQNNLMIMKQLTDNLWCCDTGVLDTISHI